MDLHAMTAGQKGLEEDQGFVFTTESSQFAKTVVVPVYAPMAGSVRDAKSAKVLRYVNTTE